MKRMIRKLIAAAMSLSAGLRVTMETTLYQLKEQMAQLEREIGTVKMGIAKDAGDPKIAMEDLRARKQRAQELQERYDMLANQATELEAAARERLRGAENGGAQMSREEAKGRFYRAVLMGEPLSGLPRMVYEQLGAIPEANADQGYGSNLLPTQLSNELLLDPLVEHPLLHRMTVTQITGLEVPKLSFAVDDDAFVTKDGATAKEMKKSADGKISFGRFKMPIMAKVSETVLRGTPFNIEREVSNALVSQQAAKLLKVTFASAPAVGEEHMSLYASGANAIIEVQGATLLDAILAAYGDLEEAYSKNASVVMRRLDYINMIRALSNGAESLFGKKPEDIIGIPVDFCDRATTPVVGDFRYLHLNYDMAPLYDTDKDVPAGNRIFSLTHWYDQHVKMKAAFRKAAVKPDSP